MVDNRLDVVVVHLDENLDGQFRNAGDVFDRDEAHARHTVQQVPPHAQPAAAGESGQRDVVAQLKDAPPGVRHRGVAAWGRLALENVRKLAPPFGVVPD